MGLPEVEDVKGKGKRDSGFVVWCVTCIRNLRQGSGIQSAVYFFFFSLRHRNFSLVQHTPADARRVHVVASIYGTLVRASVVYTAP